MSQEVAIALIGLAGVLCTTAFGVFKTMQANYRLKQAESELNLQQNILDFGLFLEEWTGTHAEVKHLLETTEIDRFMILRAWNGRMAPRWTTAVFQMRLGDQKPVSYVHFELDTDYVARLREISAVQTMHFDVAKIPDSAIKRVYEAEHVKSAVWIHLMSQQIPGADTTAITYCSFATRDPNGISPETVTRCNILRGRLKGVAMNFSEMRE